MLHAFWFHSGFHSHLIIEMVIACSTSVLVKSVIKSLFDKLYKHTFLICRHVQVPRLVLWAWKLERHSNLYAQRTAKQIGLKNSSLIQKKDLTATRLGTASHALGLLLFHCGCCFFVLCDGCCFFFIHEDYSILWWTPSCSGSIDSSGSWSCKFCCSSKWCHALLQWSSLSLYCIGGVQGWEEEKHLQPMDTLGLSMSHVDFFISWYWTQCQMDDQYQGCNCCS